MNIDEITGNLEEDFRKILNLNSDEDDQKAVVLNDRFVCKFRVEKPNRGYYCYCSESYPVEPCKKRFSNDIDVIVYDEKTGSEFYGVWTLSRDADLANQYSSALYDIEGNHVTAMFIVVNYKFKNLSEIDHEWKLPRRCIDGISTDDKASA